jgi:hypothetical protein
MDGWVDGWMGGWVDGRVDGWVDGRVDGWVGGRVDGWVGGWVAGWNTFGSFSPFFGSQMVIDLLRANGGQVKKTPNSPWWEGLGNTLAGMTVDPGNCVALFT